MPEFRTIVIVHPDDLVECHAKVREGITLLRDEFDLGRDDIRIDFTGGTKAMSAAAVLAAAPDGYRFLYVSGSRRDKDGVGAVISGSEKLLHAENPWVILEDPALRDLFNYANLGQWAAAIGICDRLRSRAADRDKSLFADLRLALNGLYAWDIFEHERAWKEWKRGKIPSELAKLAEARGRNLVRKFAEKCQGLIRYLKAIVDAKSALPRNRHDPLVLDMLANGERQAKQGRFDEASLRYYRAVELCVGRRLLLLHEIDNSAVKKGDVPQPLCGEFIRRDGEPQPTWKLGQLNSIRLLAARHDRVGERLLNHYENLDSNARNCNWLIHGQEHVDLERFLSYRGKVLEAIGISEAEIHSWPDFSAHAAE